MTTFARLLAAVILLAGAAWTLPAPVAMAAGSIDNTASSADRRDFERGRKAIESGDWKAAAARLERAARDAPDDADVFNLLAYSYRHLGRLDEAFETYRKALALDPEHRGAHEYIGEAYLMVGDPGAAERHLARLKEICRGPCEEADELAEAIAAHKAGGGRR